LGLTNDDSQPKKRRYVEWDRERTQAAIKSDYLGGIPQDLHLMNSNECFEFPGATIIRSDILGNFGIPFFKMAMIPH